MDTTMSIAEYSVANAQAKVQDALAIKGLKLANDAQAAVLELIQSLGAASDLSFAGIGANLDVTA